MKILSYIQSNAPDTEAIKRLISREAKEGMLAVEVGCWVGESTHLFAQGMKGKGILYCVDWFKGSPNTRLEASAVENDVCHTFRTNMKEEGDFDTIRTMEMTSKEALSIWADGSIDLLYIDGDHRYEEVKSDILGWLPKMKKGGLISGHDCEKKFTNCNDVEQQLVRESLSMDFHEGLNLHPGVTLALFEIFKDEFESDGVIWYKRI